MPDRKIWVLVIEDEAASRKLMAIQLHTKGFEVICTEDGDRAMEILQYCTPDCILLDLLMPRMHGYNFLIQLRKKTKNLPVIIMSAVEKHANLVATLEYRGIQGWFSKPINYKEITKRIKEVVNPNSETK